MPNIYRNGRAARNMHGWTVAFARRRRQRGSRYFADSVWGGVRAALKAAVAWRDDQVLKLQPPVRVRRWTLRNKTGVVGVKVEWRRAGGRRYRAYRASWPAPGGGTVRRLFYVSKYGKKDAFERAARARKQGLKEHEDYVRRPLALEVERRRRPKHG